MQVAKTVPKHLRTQCCSKNVPGLTETAAREQENTGKEETHTQETDNERDWTVALKGKYMYNCGGGKPTKTQRDTNRKTQPRNTRGFLWCHQGSAGKLCLAMSALQWLWWLWLILYCFRPKVERSLIINQETGCKRNLHCSNFCLSILCWIVLFELDYSLSNTFSHTHN